MMDKKELEIILKGLNAILELEKLAHDHKNDHSEDQDDGNDEQETDEIKRILEFRQEYEEMMIWAIGSFNSDMDQIEIAKRWARLHPDLTPLFLPKSATNSARIQIIAMQLIPLWQRHKNNNKKGKCSL